MPDLEWNRNSPGSSGQSWRSFTPSSFLFSSKILFTCTAHPTWSPSSFIGEHLSASCSCSNPLFWPRCCSWSHWLSFVLLSRDLDWRLGPFSFWPRRLRHFCQLITLWRYNKFFLFGKSSVIQAFPLEPALFASSWVFSVALTRLSLFFRSSSFRLLLRSC